MRYDNVGSQEHLCMQSRFSIVLYFSSCGIALEAGIGMFSILKMALKHFKCVNDSLLFLPDIVYFSAETVARSDLTELGQHVAALREFQRCVVI